MTTMIQVFETSLLQEQVEVSKFLLLNFEQEIIADIKSNPDKYTQGYSFLSSIMDVKQLGVELERHIRFKMIEERAQLRREEGSPHESEKHHNCVIS